MGNRRGVPPGEGFEGLNLSREQEESIRADMARAKAVGDAAIERDRKQREKDEERRQHIRAGVLETLKERKSWPVWEFRKALIARKDFNYDDCMWSWMVARDMNDYGDGLVIREGKDGFTVHAR
jgi:imidazolonepropionase-like amidohydrolase